MNITLIPEVYKPLVGGVENVTYNLSVQLIKKGHRVNIITPQFPGFKSYELIDGIRIDRIPICPSNTNSISKIIFTFHAAWKIRQLLKINRTEIVHLHYVGFLAASILWVSYLYKFKWITGLHGGDALLELSASATRSSAWILRRVIKKADHVVACSHHLLLKSQNRIPGIAQKSTVIHNGINANDFDLQEKYMHPRPYILSIGNFSPYKGQDILIMAFQNISKKYRDIDLILAGDGRTIKNCQELAGLLGLQDRILFLGVVRERKSIVKLLNGCEYFVLPSRYEPFGIVNLEAMAAGKAIVAASCGGVPEIIQNGVNGILVNPEDDLSLTEGMSRLLEDADLKNRLGENGKKMLDPYSWEKIVKQYLALYEKVLSDSKKEFSNPYDNKNAVDKKKMETIADLYIEKLNKGGDIYFSILSNGMRPLITPSDKILVRKVPPHQISAGDIAVYKRKDGQFTVHRILSKRSEAGRMIYTAKADARKNIDPPIEEEQIIGKVIAVKKKGVLLKLDNIFGAVVSRLMYFYSDLYFRFSDFLSRHPKLKKSLMKLRSILDT